MVLTIEFCIRTNANAAPTNNATCAIKYKRRRHTKSASAPLGKPSIKTGSAEAVCTRAISRGLAPDSTKYNVAVVSNIHIAVFERTNVNHKTRKCGKRKGLKDASKVRLIIVRDDLLV